MRKTATFIIGMAAAVLLAGTFAGAASNSPIRSNVELKSGNVLNVGDEASFAYNGSGGVQSAICAGETIPVFKETHAYGLTKRTEVGAVKVLSYKGDHEFLAKVVEGRLSNGDLAFKESATCMLYHPET